MNISPYVLSEQKQPGKVNIVNREENPNTLGNTKPRVHLIAPSMHGKYPSAWPNPTPHATTTQSSSKSTRTSSHIVLARRIPLPLDHLTFKSSCHYGEGQTASVYLLTSSNCPARLHRGLNVVRMYLAGDLRVDMACGRRTVTHRRISGRDRRRVRDDLR